jgi:hypothetical protein
MTPRAVAGRIVVGAVLVVIAVRRRGEIGRSR